MVWLLFASLSSTDAWVARGALAADRLAVAAVDERAQSRPPEQLWWSGEGQQVLELMDHRACIGTVARGCVLGEGLPSKPDRVPERQVQGRKRWDFSGDQHQILALEVVGTSTVLWIWRDRPLNQAAAAPLPAGEPQAAPSVVPPPSPSAPVHPVWFVLLPLGFLMGRWRRNKPHEPVEASRVDALEAELEAERLRQTLTQRRAERDVAQLRDQVERARSASRPADVSRIEELERSLQRVRRRWERWRHEADHEAEVSRRDASLFLAPLQQFALMLRQLERRMHALDETAYAQKIQQRRLGLQSFEERLRRHFASSVTLEERRWLALCEELDALLSIEKPVAEVAEEPAALHVLKGGR